MKFFACLILLAMAGVIACAARADEGQAAREFSECGQCSVMVAIPAGRFVMGSAKSEADHFDNEGPQHVVSVKAFALGKTLVTDKQFRDFLKATGYQPKPCNTILHTSWTTPGKGLAYSPDMTEPPDWPAVCLDWHDADAYIAWLNQLVRAAHPDIAYKPGGPYRLPTEAEWEYAARAGTTTSRWWGNAIGSGNADCNGCGSKYDYAVLAPVDAFKPNPFGLLGMLGNVWEWTADCWHKDYVHAPADGSAWLAAGGGDCTRHVVRGGSWDNTPIFVRSAARNAAAADGGELDYSSYAGFRVARDLP